VAVLVFIGGCVAAAWPSDSPLVPGFAGSLTGASKWAWLYLVCAVGAFAAYVVGVATLDRFGGALRPVAALSVAIQLAPLGAPLLLSSDAWTYWDYGRIVAVHGGNPYVDTPSDYPRDPAYPYVGAAWRHSTSVYGPAFTLASEPVALASGESADAAAWIFKSLAAVTVLAATAGATLLARRRAFACAFVGWNPLLALAFAGGGHNDAWMAALVLGALVAAASARRQWAGASWAAAVLVKWIPLLFLPLRALEARADARPVRHLGFAAAACVIVAVAWWQFGWHWLGAFGPLAHNANQETRFSIPHRLESAGVPRGVALGVLAAAFAAGYVWLLWSARRGRARLALAACFALLVTPYLAAWYLVWAVPLAAAEDDRAAQLLTLALTAYLLRQAVPL